MQQEQERRPRNTDAPSSPSSSLYPSEEACKNRALLENFRELSRVYGHVFDFEEAWHKIRDAYTPPSPPPPSSNNNTVSRTRRQSTNAIANANANGNNSNSALCRDAIASSEILLVDRLDGNKDKRNGTWRYQGTDLEAIRNTLRYLFFRHRKGIYVSIRNGRLSAYFAFQNRQFRNPLAPALELEPGTDEKIREFYKKTEAQQDEEYEKTRWKRFPAQIPPIDIVRLENKRETDRLRSMTRYQPPAFWGTTGCLVSSVFQMPPPADAQKGVEPDHGFLACKHYLEHLCLTSAVPDCDFFINTYDQLLLRRDMKVPNRHVMDSDGGTRAILRDEDRQTKIASFRNCKMCPIVSFCTGRDYLDLPFVFPDDIVRVFKMYDVPKCSNPYVDQNYELDWNKKKPTAVFRGTATGCGWTIADNPRVRLAHISRMLEHVRFPTPPLSTPNSRSYRRSTNTLDTRHTRDGNRDGNQTVFNRRTTGGDVAAVPAFNDRTMRQLSQGTEQHRYSADDAFPLLDAKLTGAENVRFKKNRWGRRVAFMTPDETGAEQRAEYAIDSLEQSRYKYVIYVEGNVAAYRLCNMFAMGSVVIYIESEYIPWIYPMLKDRVNCLIVPSVDDVPKTVLWCRENDEACKKIAEEGVRLYRSAFGLRGMKAYTLRMLHLMSRNAAAARRSVDE